MYLIKEINDYIFLYSYDICAFFYIRTILSRILRSNNVLVYYKKDIGKMLDILDRYKTQFILKNTHNTIQLLALSEKFEYKHRH